MTEYEVTRTRYGVDEHKHTGFDYWHPASRIHGRSPSVRQMPERLDLARTVWDVDADEIYDIIESMSGMQTRYVDLHGELLDITDLLQAGNEHETMSPEWAVVISNLPRMETQVTYTAGHIRKLRMSSYHNGVEFSHGRVYYDVDTNLHDAKILIESGLAAKYIKYPSLVDAIHILHVSGGDRYYDLIRLPSGGHLPVDILENEYGVSWETIARIPLGKPRTGETFICPICGETSYFSGVCSSCSDICGDCIGDDGDDDCEFCEYYYHVSAEIDDAENARTVRKEQEHGEILRLVKSDNWKHCRYISGETMSEVE